MNILCAAKNCSAKGESGSGGVRAMAKPAMVVVLSPAKTLDMAAAAGQFLCTAPRMQAQAATLLVEMKRKDKGALKKMMSVSDAVADLNYKRFQSFEDQDEKQAALAFDGPAYKGLKAHTFTAKQQAFANAHLRILCGLYGVLRPFDQIRSKLCACSCACVIARAHLQSQRSSPSSVLFSIPAPRPSDIFPSVRCACVRMSARACVIVRFIGVCALTAHPMPPPSTLSIPLRPYRLEMGNSLQVGE
jgi:hypothetical protein